MKTTRDNRTGAPKLRKAMALGGSAMLRGKIRSALLLSLLAVVSVSAAHAEDVKITPEVEGGCRIQIPGQGFSVWMPGKPVASRDDIGDGKMMTKLTLEVANATNFRSLLVMYSESEIPDDTTALTEGMVAQMATNYIRAAQGRTLERVEPSKNGSALCATAVFTQVVDNAATRTTFLFAIHRKHLVMVSLGRPAAEPGLPVDLRAVLESVRFD